MGDIGDQGFGVVPLLGEDLGFPLEILPKTDQHVAEMRMVQKLLPAAVLQKGKVAGIVLVQHGQYGFLLKAPLMPGKEKEQCAKAEEQEEEGGETCEKGDFDALIPGVFTEPALCVIPIPGEQGFACFNAAPAVLQSRGKGLPGLWMGL